MICLIVSCGVNSLDTTTQPRRSNGPEKTSGWLYISRASVDFPIPPMPWITATESPLFSSLSRIASRNTSSTASSMPTRCSSLCQGHNRRRNSTCDISASSAICMIPYLSRFLSTASSLARIESISSPIRSRWYMRFGKLLNLLRRPLLLPFSTLTRNISMVSSASKDCIDSSSSFSNRTFSSTPRRDFTFWISRLPSSSTADEIAASAAISIDISLGFLRDGGEETNGTTMIK